MLTVSTQEAAMKKPSKSILDRSFIYVPSASTSVNQTWRRFGWRPITETTFVSGHVTGNAQTSQAAPTRQ